MAKVMISLPDDLLERIDAFARQRGTTRSGLLRELAEREMEADLEARGKRIRALLATARPHGGDSARLVREMRDARQ
jgi:metal-responsive CopG/Arc/MetJ family transcriptional regulator